MRIHRLKLKINVVGERAVGKTSLIQRYVEARHNPEYKGTLGVHMHRVDVELPGDEPGDVILANIAIFDQMGEHAIRENFRDALFYGTQGALAVCDIERPDTLRTLAEWIRSISVVTGGVPFRIVFNKVDRAKGSKIGPEESAWLKDNFPGAPTSLTSAATGEGVEEAFAGIIGQAVDALMAGEKNRKVRKLLRQRILVFAARREGNGITKSELFANMRDVKPDEVMEELDNLVRLDLLVQYDAGPKTFLKSSTLPATFRYQITPLGRKVAASPAIEDLVVE